MTQTQHLGYGPFRLEDFAWGEEFARCDGSLAKVCDRQPYATLTPAPRSIHLPDHLLVWIHWGTSNAVKVLLHRTACAYALSIDQARSIEARKRRKEKSR